MWYLFAAAGIIFLVLEILTPVLFFLNLSIAAFFTAVLSLYCNDLMLLTAFFSVLSIVLIFTLRPFLVKYNKNKKEQTGMESKYVGKTATVTEDIDKNSGTISIYDERWQARNTQDGIIEKGSTVEIVGYESIVMYVVKK